MSIVSLSLSDAILVSHLEVEPAARTIEGKEFEDSIDHDNLCNLSNGLKDNVVPGTSSGYVCHSSFKREVFIR